MNSNFFFIKNKIYHLLFWLGLFGGWYYFRYQDFSTTRLAMKMILVKVLDLAFLVYFTNYFLLPQLLYKKKYIVFTFAYIVAVASLSFLKMYIEGQLLNRPDMFNFGNNLKVRIYDNIIPHFLLVSTGAAFKIMIDYSKAQRRLSELAKEKAETELNFLKSQINPHFLFNSINSVYFLIDKKNHEAREALHTFSEMLRYQLYECGGNKIPIEKEIKYLKDYVDLQALRRDGNFGVEFNIESGVGGFLIEPLLLIPFVENSFKHVSHHTSDRRNHIRISLSQNENVFTFETSNTTDERLAKELLIEGGIGLPNVKRRLELLYPKRHTLLIREEGLFFSVQLKLLID